MPNAFLFSLDNAEPVTHALTLEAMQATVGGYIEPAFTIDSPARPGYALTGYVNEEGLLEQLPVAVLTSINGPLAGPMLVCGLEYASGDTAPLTPEELDWLASRTRLLAAAGTGGTTKRALHALDLR